MLTLIIVALILMFVAPRLLAFLIVLGMAAFFIAIALAVITGGALFGGALLLAL